MHGQVQDMLDPEYYIGALQCSDGTWVTAKYADQLPVSDTQGRNSRIWERKPLYCVPVAGESAWVADRLEGASPPGYPPSLQGALTELPGNRWNRQHEKWGGSTRKIPQ
jgi:Mini-chromosome maintenance replisome factor